MQSYFSKVSMVKSKNCNYLIEFADPGKKTARHPQHPLVLRRRRALALQKRGMLPPACTVFTILPSSGRSGADRTTGSAAITGRSELHGEETCKIFSDLNKKEIAMIQMISNENKSECNTEYKMRLESTDWLMISRIYPHKCSPISLANEQRTKTPGHKV